jgi:hypothetical protein
MGKVLDHTNHWQQWWQYTDPDTNTKLVRCAKCNHVWLYWGEIPLNSKDVLELDLEQPILKEKPKMPNTTNQPPFRVVNPPTHEENYESDLNYDPDYREGEVTPVPPPTVRLSQHAKGHR